MTIESYRSTKPIPRFDLCVDVESDGFCLCVKVKVLIYVIFGVTICEPLKVDLYSEKEKCLNWETWGRAKIKKIKKNPKDRRDKIIIINNF